MASDHKMASTVDLDFWATERKVNTAFSRSAVFLTVPNMVGLQATGNDGEAALRETGSINRSLFTLGQVLAGLSMRKPSFRYL